MEEIINLLMALPLAILANILFGSVIAETLHKFKWEIAFAGILKGIGVYAGIAMLIGVGLLLPNLKIAINETELSVILALQVVLTGAIAFYASKAIQNLVELTKIKVSVAYTPKNDYKEEIGLG